MNFKIFLLIFLQFNSLYAQNFTIPVQTTPSTTAYPPSTTTTLFPLPPPDTTTTTLFTTTTTTLFTTTTTTTSPTTTTETTTIPPPYNPCENLASGRVGDSTNCTIFYTCVDYEISIIHRCPPSQIFIDTRCVNGYPDECIESTGTAPTITSTTSTVTDPSTTTTNTNTPPTPTLEPFNHCENVPNGQRVADLWNCTIFYTCVDNEISIIHQCQPGRIFVNNTCIIGHPSECWGFITIPTTTTTEELYSTTTTTEEIIDSTTTTTEEIIDSTTTTTEELDSTTTTTEEIIDSTTTTTEELDSTTTTTTEEIIDSTTTTTTEEIIDSTTTTTEELDSTTTTTEELDSTTTTTTEEIIDSTTTTTTEEIIDSTTTTTPGIFNPCENIDSGNVANENDCTQYFTCENGSVVGSAHTCGTGSIFIEECIRGDPITCLPDTDAICRFVFFAARHYPGDNSIFVGCIREIPTIMRCYEDEVFDRTTNTCVNLETMERRSFSEIVKNFKLK